MDVARKQDNAKTWLRLRNENCRAVDELIVLKLVNLGIKEFDEQSRYDIVADITKQYKATSGKEYRMGYAFKGLH